MGLLLFGVFVGTIVGLWEGPVGEKVGNSVGSNEGCPVGLLGLRVGVAVRKTIGTAVGIGVGCDDGSLAKIINCTSSFVVAFPLESFVETVVSSEDPQVVDRIPQKNHAMNMYIAPLLFDLQITLLC